MRSFFSSFLEVVEVAAIAIAAVFLVREFLVQPFLVSGSSMVPNFSNGDYLLVDELTYRFRPPARGDVIVFHYPQNESTYFIKRIIGLPGEKVTIKNGAIMIINSTHPDGFAVDESYLPKGIATNDDRTVTLGTQEYYVLGDNRQYSFDSRIWGPLASKEIVGVVRLRLWPPEAFAAFMSPQYGT